MTNKKHSANTTSTKKAKVLNDFMLALYQGRNPRSVVAEARVVLPSHEFTKLTSYIKNNSSLHNRVFTNAFPESLRQLSNYRAMPSTNIEKEIAWAISVLKIYRPQLSSYLKIKDAFNRAMLLGEYDSALNELSNIELQFGMSLWLIKRRINVLQVSKGMETQKAYAKDLIDKSSQVGIGEFLLYFISIRNEESLILQRFAKQFISSLEQIESSIPLIDYCMFHVLPNVHADSSLYHDILRMESTGAVIDYYETLLRICLLLTGEDLLDETVINVLYEFFASVGEVRFGHLLYKNHINIKSSVSTETYEMWLMGSYGQAEYKAMGEIIENPTDPATLLIAAQACSTCIELHRKGENVLVSNIVMKMSNILVRGYLYDADINDLLQISTNNSGEPWAELLFYFLKEQQSNHAIGLNATESTQAYCFIASNHSVFAPWFSSSKFRTSLLQALSSDIEIGLCQRYSIAEYNSEVVAGEAHLSSFCRDVLNGRSLYKTTKFMEASALSNNIITSNMNYFEVIGFRLSINSRLDYGKMVECLHLTAFAIVNKHNYLDSLPIRAIGACMDESTLDDLIGEISLCIFLDYYSRHVNKLLDEHKTFAFLGFLDLFHCSKPSEIEAVIGDDNRADIVYFLRFVCTEPLLELSGIFGGSQAVTEERLQICKILIEIDNSHHDIYQNEIKDIYQRITIYKGLRNIEQSKIYVDLDSVRNTVRKLHRDSYNRYMSLLRGGLADFSPIKSAIEEATTLPVADKSIILTIPKSEALDLLESMLGEIRDEFVSSTDHGLIRYLSTRIRHGVFDGQLRGPLDAQNLITPKDGTTGMYVANHYWTSRMNMYNSPDKELVVNRLGEFSHAFDDLVEKVMQSWLRIRKNSTDQGLFDFRITKIHALDISKKVSQGTTFDEFVEDSLRYLLELLNFSLSNIRQHLESELKSQLSELLQSLQVDIEAVVGTGAIRDFTNAIRATVTELLVTIDRMKAWFQYSEVVPTEPINIIDVIEIGAESVRVFASNFTVDTKIDRSLEAVFVEGRIVTHYVDILFIIFENIARHARVASNPSCVVLITHLENIMKIHVENKVSDSVDIEVESQRISAIKDSMKNAAHDRLLSSEGGSGFHKINKILAHDVQTSPDLNFGFTKQRSFFVEFSSIISSQSSLDMLLST